MMSRRRRSLSARRNVEDLEVSIAQGPLPHLSPTREVDLLETSPSVRVENITQQVEAAANVEKKQKRPLGLKPLNMAPLNMQRSIVTPSSAHPSSAQTFSPEGESLSATPYRREPVEVLSGIFLGSERNASSREVLVRKNIGYILNVGKECRNHFEITATTDNAESTMSNTQTSATSLLESSTGAISPLYNPLNLAAADDHLLRRKPRSAQPLDGAYEHLISPTLSTNTDPGNAADILSRRFLRQASLETSPSAAGIFDFSTAAVAGEERPLSPVDLSTFQPPRYLKLPWTHNEENIVQIFPTAFNFIEEARTNGRGVLIHCKQGVSRSATLVIAYLMKHERISMNQAYSLLKEKSPSISPNLALIYQLLDFERTLMTEADEK
eukprot:Partr_v1_DN28979_c0_g2_i1_m25349 putative phosphatase